MKNDSHRDLEFNTFVFSETSEIQYAMGKNVYGGSWSPNSQYILYLKTSFYHVLDMESKREILGLPSYKDGFRRTGDWSPNSRYLPFVLTARDRYDGKDSDTWIIKNVENLKANLQPWKDGIFHSRFIGWSNNSQYAYFTDEYHLYQYDMSQNILTELYQFPYNLFTPDYPKVRQTTAQMSPDGSKILLYLEDKFTFIIELENLVVTEIISFQPTERIMWHPNSQHIIAIDGSIGYRSSKEAKVLLYNIETDDYIQIDTKTSDDIAISPTGRYLSYVEGGSNFQAETRRLYDLNNKNDIL